MISVYRTAAINLIGASCVLAGCMVGPRYRTPTADTPAAYKELTPADYQNTDGWKIAQPKDDALRGKWWEIFSDPQLNDLEEKVNVSNQSIAEATASFFASRALVKEARAQLFPTVSASPSITAQRPSANARVGSSSGSGAGVSSSSTGTFADFTLPFDATWQPDLFGRVRNTINAAAYGAQASAADLENTRLTIQAEVAVDYFQLRGQDRLKQLLDSAVDDYQKSLDLTTALYETGIGTEESVAQAETQLESTQAQDVALGIQRAQFEHAIAMLTGHPPADLSIPVTAMQKDVPVVPTGIPSTLLERRPDIAAAERQMQEENALIGVAISAYYPDISLTALAGFAGSPLSQLFTTASRVWSLGASASETIFDAGARTAAVAVARATYDEFVADYRQTVLAAFQQVEDQLVALRVLQQQAVAQDAAVASARHAVEVTLNQYLAGTVAYTSVITEQTLELSDEQTVLTIQQSRLVASVTLIQSLGGGWQASDVPSNFAIEPKQLVP
jgi:NodT family efflux transporter outer membrane factor (OMF) lipoprotein